MSGHSEEAAEFPKLAGNMIVLDRDAISGYKLQCGCGEEFMYIPIETNAITTERHGTVRNHAICPRCKCLWFEDAEFVRRVTPVKFAYYHADSVDEALKIAGIGSAPSRAEAVNMVANELRQHRIDWGVFVVKVLSEAEAETLEKSMNQKDKAMRMAALATILGIALEGGNDGGEHSEK